MTFVGHRDRLVDRVNGIKRIYYEDKYVYVCPGQVLRLRFYLGRSWSPGLIASRSVSGADYPTSSPTKWDFRSERECPALLNEGGFLLLSRGGWIIILVINWSKKVFAQ